MSPQIVTGLLTGCTNSIKAELKVKKKHLLLQNTTEYLSVQSKHARFGRGHTQIKFYFVKA